MTRRRLTLLVRFAKSVHSLDTRQPHTAKPDHAGRPAGLHNVKRWRLYEAFVFPRDRREARDQIQQFPDL